MKAVSIHARPAHPAPRKLLLAGGAALDAGDRRRLYRQRFRRPPRCWPSSRGLPQGAVVLPGLDQAADEATWRAIRPRAAIRIRRLPSRIRSSDWRRCWPAGRRARSVRPWPAPGVTGTTPLRAATASRALAPATCAERAFGGTPVPAAALDGVSLLEAAIRGGGPLDRVDHAPALEDADLDRGPGDARSRPGPPGRCRMGGAGHAPSTIRPASRWRTRRRRPSCGWSRGRRRLRAGALLARSSIRCAPWAVSAPHCSMPRAGSIANACAV